MIMDFLFIQLEHLRVHVHEKGVPIAGAKNLDFF